MRIRLYLLSLLLICVSSKASSQMVFGQDTLVGNEWISYNQTYYKFTIDADGVYRIPLTTLQAAGLSAPAGSSIRIYSLGHQVPVYVSTDGVFSADDFVEFFGFKNRGDFDRHLFMFPDADMLHPDHSMYTDSRPYYLTIEGTGIPLRVTTLSNDVTNPPSPEPYYIHQERIEYSTTMNDPYYQISGGGAISYSSYMHGEGFSKFSETNSSTEVLTSNIADGPDALLHLRLVSTNYGNHEFIITWNGTILDTLLATDLQLRDTIYNIPLSLLQGLNQLNISNNNSISRHSLVSIALSYPRKTIANGSALAEITLIPQPGTQYLVLDDFVSAESPVIYTKDGLTRMVGDKLSANQIHFLWPQIDSPSTLHIADPGTTTQIVQELERKEFVDFVNDDTEYIVITHPALLDIGTESPYIQYRSSATGGGYKAKAYSILDIYEQFGYGIEKHPQSIRNFVEFFHRHWPSAKMIFIVGRAIEYNRSRYANGSWEPSFFVPTFGRPGADNLLAATLWDLVPRYPIGRIAVIDQNALNSYLEKVKEHDSSIYNEQSLEGKSWMKNVIHIGGGKDINEQANFKEILNSLGKDISESDFGANVSYFQKESTDIIGESTSKQIEKLLKEGSSIINYLGHSSASTFEFTINDPAEWNNKGRYPVFSGMGCSAGQIHGPIFSLSDRYVQIQDEGAIAFISGSGSQFPSALISWARPWYNYFGSLNYGSTLGESVLFGLKALKNYVNLDHIGSVSYRYLLEQQTFQGDPAIKLNPLPGPDYLINPNSVSIDPEILNTQLDSFDLDFSINNIGRNLRQTLDYTISLRSADGEETILRNDSVRCEEYSTIVSHRLPLSNSLSAGAYRLLIEIDPDGHVEELPSPHAELNNHLEDNLGVEGFQIVLLNSIITAVYPPDFAIINSAPELIASGSNAFEKSQHFVIEIDTTPLFNSPDLIRDVFDNHSATLKWTPVVDYQDNQEYYWRVSQDSISPHQGYLWSKRSFIFKANSPHGWNQSHFYQQTENLLEQMVRDSAHYAFDFERSVINFRILNRYHNPASGELPFGFVDNVFYTEFFTKFYANDIHVFVVAVNPVTGAFMLNPNPGLYGSFNNLSYDIRCFPYRTDLPESRQALIHFIQNIIPPDYFVFLYTYQRPPRPDFFPEQWASDEENFEYSIFSLIESEYPTSAIRTLATTGSKPYIVFFQKGHGGIEEVLAKDTAEVISLSYDIKESLDNGTMISSLVGPASKWYSIHWNKDIPAIDTSGKEIISAWALRTDLSDTLWISHHFLEQDINIEHIDASIYPYIQLSYATQDSVDFTPANLDFWRVLYEGYPELVIQPDLGFEFIADTLNQGETMSLNTYVENVSPYDVDSMLVSLKIFNSNNTTEEITKVINDIKGLSGSFIDFEKNTSTLEGDYQVLMEINSDRGVSELNYNNNIGILPMHVVADRANPVLDVTFDGYHIKDGDLVAAEPLIMITLLDENEHLRLDDTTSFAIYLSYPSSSNARRIYFSEPWVRFTPAPSTGQNLAIVELTPTLSENGIYTLQVHATDATGNLSGDNDYMVSFEVINEASVSSIYNYPNPFSSSTRFIYTLTGPGSPSYYKIEIMSMTGILVNEITQDQLGPLAVGEHMTEYRWDGTDQNGNELPAGMYLYRMIVKDEDGNELNTYLPYGESSYNSIDWGKLIIVR